MIIGIWLLTLFIASLGIPYYLRRYKKADLACGVYVIYLALSQIIASKIATFDLIFAQFTAPAAVLIFPFTFQITDIVNEALGRYEVHRMIFIAFLTQVLMTLFLYLGTLLPPAPFWNNSEAWARIFNLVPRITLASWLAFLVSENLDAVLYAQLRKVTKNRHLWIRNIFSDLISLAVDSGIFVTLAFYGVLPVLPLIWGQIVLKWLVGVLDTPFMYLSRWVLYYKGGADLTAK
jgi:uncharacterized integral membrane protein (TIGR00697 family)